MNFYFKPRLMVVVASGLGIGVFVLTGMPLPFLLGPMLGCLIFALSGVKLKDMGTVGTFMRTLLGVAIGSTITPDMIEELPSFGPTLLAVPVYVALIAAVGIPFFHKIIGYSKATSLYAAMPGGLQDMLVFGEIAGADVRTISLIHATRVLAIVTIAPFFLAALFDIDLSNPPGAPARDFPSSQLALFVLSGLLGWKIAARAGLFGASLLGPLILTAILSLAGVIQSRPPAEMIWAAQLFIGIAVGARYTGITAREVRSTLSAALMFSLILAVLSLLFIWGLQYVTDRPLEVTLAFLPGGQAEMSVIAIVAGADVAFVVAHHLLRLVIVIISAPLLGRKLRQVT